MRVIATREFYDDDGNVAVVVRIAEPTAGAAAGDPWTGVVRFEVDGKAPVDEGVVAFDAVQVLQLSLEVARVRLEGWGLSLSAFKGAKGDLGLYRPISGGYGRAVYDRLARAHDEELVRVFDERAARDPAFAAARKSAP